ncbi:uncharacterized protein LOC104439958 [Eucalyptus grandis]|uniref:Uncharacterized protein n=2 Tax=Eucalyptus grandis TaxID=71139 RepID=A0ACC3M452_EUCGR|nr:uncharacterized protein LOC104439958 [Eucalyptus grandis]KAK3445968.1 hypothetical protein EUGRSUZ_A01738 [Eucalyptus grandis]
MVKVKGVGILLCILIIGLDIAAGILGLEAEVEQNKEKHMRLGTFECKEPSPKVFKLGVGAAVLLALAHVLANLLGGCYNRICTHDGLQQPLAHCLITIACLVLTWILLAIGLSLLVIGTLANHKSRGSCGISHHHFLSIGGVVCFIHGLFSVAYYVSATPPATATATDG